jgi:hypothetical protein
VSSKFDGAEQQAFQAAQAALEKLLQLQRKVKACADALKVAHNPRTYERIASEYVALLDQWDLANSEYNVAKNALNEVIETR